MNNVNPFNQSLSVGATITNGVASFGVSASKDFDGDARRNEGFFRIEAAAGVLSVEG